MKYFLLFLLLPVIIFSQKVQTVKQLPVTITQKKLDLNAANTFLIGAVDQQKYASLYQSEKQQKVKSISFVSQNVLKFKSSINFCVYKNNNGSPGNIIGNYKIPVIISQGKNLITIHFNEALEIPKEGVFFGFEWNLNSKNKYVNDSKVFAPAISSAERAYEKSNLWVFDGKQWTKESDDSVFSQIYFEFFLID